MYLCAEVYHIPHSQFLGWEAGDRAKAIAWHERRSQTCLRCGTRAEEWHSGKRPYKPHIHLCPGCRESATMQKNIPEGAREFSHVILQPVE